LLHYLLFFITPRPPTPTLFPYTTLFRSLAEVKPYAGRKIVTYHRSWPNFADHFHLDVVGYVEPRPGIPPSPQHTVEMEMIGKIRSEEHTSELQSRGHLVCRLLLEKKKK